MKILNSSGAGLLLALFLTLSACGGNAGNENTTSAPAAGEESGQPAQTGDEYSSAYVCPMHCEGSGSTDPGQCPVCGMDYVPLADHKADGHSHEEESHEGHDH